MAKALKIDSTAKTVTEIDVPAKQPLDTLKGIVRGYIEFAHEFPNGDVLYVDEEGLTKNPEHFFDIKAHQPFAGDGVIVGKEMDDDGTLADCETKPADLTVTWLSPSEAYMLARRRGQ